MTTLDTQGRITLSADVRNVADLNFQEEIRIFLKTKGNKNFLILSNNVESNLPCFGKVSFDDKFRFCVPKDLRKFLDLDSKTPLLVYTIKGQLTIQKL